MPEVAWVTDSIAVHPACDAPRTTTSSLTHSLARAYAPKVRSNYQERLQNNDLSGGERWPLDHMFA